jgi:uncharacterized membrane-anchored protein YjiN (DUF445 family)
MTPAHDPRRAQLRRLKALALGLLLLMLAGFAVSHWQGERGIWAWVSAFCEAAAVGALADWFAVVALFRRPMGLPIPHTAIIPRSKERIGDSLALFVRDQFLEPGVLLAKLRVFDPASRLGSWLADPARSRMLADMARGWALQALDFFDETAVRRQLHAFVVQQLRQWNAAATAGELLALLTADGRHQRVLDEGLQRLGRWLEQPEVKERASQLIVRYIQREWPTLSSTVNWVKPIDEIGDSLAERLARAVLEELQQVLAEPQHPLRQDYETWLQNYVQRLREDPALAERIEQLKQEMIDHPALQDYVQGLWAHPRQPARPAARGLGAGRPPAAQPRLAGRQPAGRPGPARGPQPAPAGRCATPDRPPARGRDHAYRADREEAGTSGTWSNSWN